MKNLNYIDWELARQREQMHIHTQKVDAVWLEGYFYPGPIYKNPYKKSSRQYKQWNQGWWCAAKGLDPFIYLYANQYQKRMAAKFDKLNKN